MLKYRNKLIFFVLIEYPATLLNSLVNPNVLPVYSFGLSMCIIISSAKNDSFISSFSILIPYTHFSCFITLAKTFKAMLYRSGIQWTSLSGSHLRENAFDILLLHICNIYCIFLQIIIGLWAFPLILNMQEFS